MPSDGLLVVEHGKFSDEFSARNILCQFLFNHGDFAAIHGTATYLCIWDPGISFKFKALIGAVNTKPPLLLGSIGTFGFIVYAYSVTQVWDPGQQRCMHSPILLFVFALTAVTSLNFNSRDTFAKWAIAYKMVVMELKVDDTCAEVNRVFEDSSQRVSSREIQSIAPLDIIRLPKLFRFLQQLLAQLFFVLQAPKSNVRYAAIGGDVCSRKKIVEHAVSAYLACLQGCIKTMADSIEQELRNLSMLEEIMVYFGTQGVPASYATGYDLEFEYTLTGYSADEFISLIMPAILDSGDKFGCLPTFSLYEFVALQTCENDHWSLIVIESELELVKVASIVAAYVVHKAMLNECKNTFILVSCGKVKTTTRLMHYLAHFRGHRRVKERIIAQQVLESNPVLKVLHNIINTIPIKFSSHRGISGKIQLAEL
ncbi:hypothetical protein KY285_019175 [Solanum tuberosum]|nr:hypothetical protein KY285_019175 [Solanum tuberosum]